MSRPHSHEDSLPNTIPAAKGNHAHLRQFTRPRFGNLGRAQRSHPCHDGTDSIVVAEEAAFPEQVITSG